jgi:holliday junction DNA helicase RuvA
MTRGGPRRAFELGPLSRVDRAAGPGYVQIRPESTQRMIGKLKGAIVAEEPPMLTVDVSGVGYEVSVPVGTSTRAREDSGLVELWIHTVLRTDVLELFGFAAELDRRVFRLLIAVPNVGPRTALGVLSALPVRDLVEAIQASDVVRLTRVPGIGKKTAERLVLELRGKLPMDELGKSPAAAPQTPPTGDAKTRLLSALTNMGYRPAEAERAVSALGPRVGDAPLSELLREALAQLSA